MPVSAGRSSPGFPACTLSPERVEGSLEVWWQAPKAQGRGSRSACRLGGGSQSVRDRLMAGPVDPLAVSCSRADSLPTSVQMLGERFHLRGPPRAEGAVSSRRGAQPSIRPPGAVSRCPAAPPHTAPSSLQALLHKDAPHADRHRVQVRLSRSPVSVRPRISSDALRTLFKDCDFSRDTAVTKLVALW